MKGGKTKDYGGIMGANAEGENEMLREEIKDADSARVKIECMRVFFWEKCQGGQ